MFPQYVVWYVPLQPLLHSNDSVHEHGEPDVGPPQGETAMGHHVGAFSLHVPLGATTQRTSPVQPPSTHIEPSGQAPHSPPHSMGPPGRASPRAAQATQSFTGEQYSPAPHPDAIFPQRRKHPSGTHGASQSQSEQVIARWLT